MYTALCMHHLVGGLRLATLDAGDTPASPQITRLLRWPLTAFCVHRLLCAPPCMCTAFFMHGLVCGLQLASLGAGDTPAPPLSNKTPAVATDRILCATLSLCTALYVHCLVYAPPCMWTTARFA